MKILIDKETVDRVLACAERCESLDGKYSWADIPYLMQQALEQSTEQEPVGAQCKFDCYLTWNSCSVEHHNLVQSEPEKWPQYKTRLIYTQPQEAAPRQWAGLTEKERLDLAVDLGAMSADWIPFMEAVEARLKEKNT